MSNDTDTVFVIHEPRPPYMVVRNSPDGEFLQINREGTNDPLIKVFFDGRLEYGEGYEPDEAARVFWAAMARVPRRPSVLRRPSVR